MGQNAPDLLFPHLGIVIEHMKNDVMIGNFRIAFYGIIIGCGFLLAMFLVDHLAKKRGYDPDLYWDFFVYIILAGIIGARAFYVFCEWDYYGAHPEKIFAIREGGLAIYGGIIAVVLTLFVFCRIKKEKPFRMLDTLIPGLLLGQIMGRWGNFFNCEAFGRYTDCLFAMRMKKSVVNPTMIDETHLAHLITENGTEYIQAHPTFLYESLWNLAGLFLILTYDKKKKKADGEDFFLYMIWYGLGRFWIEGLRTDSLYIPGTGIRISQAISVFGIVAGIAGILFMRKQAEKMPAKASEEEERIPSEEATGTEIPAEEPAENPSGTEETQDIVDEN